MKYDLILWDMDGTLLDFKFAQRRALQEVFRTRGIEFTEEVYQIYTEINDYYWKKYELLEITKADLIDRRFLDFFQRLEIKNIDLSQLKKDYAEVIANVYDYIDDSLSLCKMLQTKCKQYIITNGTADTQRKKIALSGFKDCIEGCFISDEIGSAKPHSEFFDVVKQSITSFDPKRTLIVGDTISSDIKGGLLAGIPTCYYNPERLPLEDGIEPDYEIDHLWDVLPILGMSTV